MFGTTIIELGFIYSLLAMSSWLTSKLLNYDDLAMEASFGCGGAITARILTLGIPPLLTPFAALIIGAIIGILVGILHTKIKLNSLMTGIIIISGFFSINLIVGSANLPIINCDTFFSSWPNCWILGKSVLPLLIIVSSIFILLFKLLKSEVGMLMHAVGSNSNLVRSLGKNPDLYKTLIVMIANAITALAGSLFVQYTGFFSIWSSIGILVVALTSLMIAQIFSKKFGIQLILGALLYQLIIATILQMDVAPEWNKLITAILLIILMLIQFNKDHND